MRKKKVEETFFNKPVKHTRLGKWRYVSLILVVLMIFSVQFAALTYFAGLTEAEEFLVESRKYHVTHSNLLVHDYDEGVQSGLSNEGSFAVIHEIVISNEDDVPGEFIVSSTISRESDESFMAERTIIKPGDLYAFTFVHDKAWAIGDFEAEYQITVPRIESVGVEDVVSEKVVAKPTWAWPWPFKLF